MGLMNSVIRYTRNWHENYIQIGINMPSIMVIPAIGLWNFGMFEQSIIFKMKVKMIRPI